MKNILNYILAILLVIVSIFAYVQTVKLIEKGKMVKVTYVDGTKVLVREMEGEK